MPTTLASILPLIAILTLLLACEPDPWESRGTERKIDRINSIATVNARATAKAKTINPQPTMKTLRSHIPTTTAQTAKAKTINPQPTVETTLADLAVWRLCATDWADDQKVRSRLDAVYSLDTSELRKHRTYSLKIVNIIEDMIDSWPNIKASEVRELHNACADLQRADWERR